MPDSTDMLKKLEEGNQQELVELNEKVQIMKRLSLQINTDLDKDANILNTTADKADQTQNSLTATLDNLTSSFTNGGGFSRPLHLSCYIFGAVIIFYVLLLR